MKCQAYPLYNLPQTLRVASSLKNAWQIKVKVLSVADGKISLSMKALETQEEEKEIHYEYKSSGEVSTGLGELLKGLNL